MHFATLAALRQFLKLETSLRNFVKMFCRDIHATRQFVEHVEKHKYSTIPLWFSSTAFARDRFSPALHLSLPADHHSEECTVHLLVICLAGLLYGAMVMQQRLHFDLLVFPTKLRIHECKRSPTSKHELMAMKCQPTPEIVFLDQY
jgi:hypothetical protein